MTNYERCVSVFCVCLVIVRQSFGVEQDADAPWLLFANHTVIVRLSMDGQDYTVISQGHKNVEVLDYDYRAQKIYFADDVADQMLSVNVDGSSPETIERHHSVGVTGIAVDWIARKLYWTMTSLRGVYVAELNGTHVKVLVKNSPKPRGIALHPGRGFVFWTNWGMAPFIGRVGMDGSGVRQIITSRLVSPSGISVDYQTNTVWWSDITYDRIECANLDGSNRSVKFTGVKYAFAIEVFRGSVFWSDWIRNTIERGDITHPNNRTILIKTTDRPSDVHIYHADRQPFSPNPCEDDNGGCSHLCLIAAGGGHRSCACPENFVLGADGKTCTANCSSTQFECGRSDHKCIPLESYCDGSPDCMGGEDEGDQCGEAQCLPGLFRCLHGGCVQPLRLCDGKADCDDGSDENATMCADHVCVPHQFRCRTGQCILTAWACDRTRECLDGSDEFPLNPLCSDPTGCLPSQFTCISNQKCIPLSYRCDGFEDCNDGSDEPTSTCFDEMVDCEEGSVRCDGSYECVPTTGLCDGETDCSNGWDEDKTNCPQCDPSTHFTCATGECIPVNWKCDSVPDCSDESDEDDSMCQGLPHTCSAHQFTCKNGNCIQTSFVCDTNDDCGDNSDEVNCEAIVCETGMFMCQSGQCISQLDECNGWKDCEDFSDEHDDCPTHFPNGRLCPTYEFQCTNKVCIIKSWECDGTDDCGDGSDEAIELCRPRSCDQQTHFLCDNYACVPRWELCDGIDNCGDQSDENRTMCVTTGLCSTDEYRCANNQCVSEESVCNTVDECGDFSDEIGCYVTDNSSCGVNNGGCEGNCTTLTARQGYRCSCPSGFVVSVAHPKSCVDVDECLTWGNFCPQKCVNTKGSFKCECAPGFIDITHNGTVCDPPDNNRTELESYTLAGGSEIWQYFPRGQTYRAFVMNQGEIRATDHDPVNRMIFWVDATIKQLKRAQIPLDEDNVDVMSFAQDLGITGLVDPSGVAYDWAAGNVYWTDVAQSAIFVARSDGNYEKTIIIEPDVRPSAIVVDPELGIMFWLEAYGEIAKIMRADMDGGDQHTLIDTEVIFPVDLVIDYHMGHRLYWSDSKKGVIESTASDGSDRVIVIKHDLSSVVSLDVFAGNLLWMSSSEVSQVLYRQDKFGRGVKHSVLSGWPQVTSAKVFYPHEYYAQVSNLCEQKNCVGLCLLSPGGATCVCPDGATLVSADHCDVSNLTVVNRPKPAICRCENGGLCARSGEQTVCYCVGDYHGVQCELLLKHKTWTSQRIVTLVVPLVVLVSALMVISLMSVWLVYYRKRRAKYVQDETAETPGESGQRQEPVNNQSVDQDSFSMTQFTNPLYASIERIARSKEERTEE